MNNAEVFQRVASRQLTPDQGAELMLEHDRQQRAAKTKKPKDQGLLVLILSLVCTMVLTFVGIKSES
jgi:hypothetical protein